MNDYNAEFDVQAYQSRQRERSKMVRERRRIARRKRQIRRLIIAGIIMLAVLGLLICLLVAGIKAIIKSVNRDKNKAEVQVVEEIIEPNIIEEREEEKIDIPSYLGYNASASEGNTCINGMQVFNGYEIKNSEKAYYINSPNVQSLYGILIDGRNGEVVCQKEGFVRINPASMTKILTILVAAENLSEEDLQKTVTITAEDTYYAYKNDLSAAGFANDETVTVEDLFYGTILPSGADAAMALAKFVAGDVDSFIGLMNGKISELGLKNTHFTNCVGSYDADHYSTCADMAMILKATIENDYCYKVMNAHRYTTSKTEAHPDGIDISNWFLRRIEDKDTGGEVLCAKTGFVSEAGSCAASFSKQNDGHPFFCVTAWAHSAWRCIYDQVDIYANCTSDGENPYKDVPMDATPEEIIEEDETTENAPLE